MRKVQDEESQSFTFVPQNWMYKGGNVFSKAIRLIWISKYHFSTCAQCQMNGLMVPTYLTPINRHTQSLSLFLACMQRTHTISISHSFAFSHSRLSMFEMVKHTEYYIYTHTHTHLNVYLPCKFDIGRSRNQNIKKSLYRLS